ncbi:MAG: LysR family transcriptional regulator [Sphaerochaetaceae bacterium]
MNFQNMEYFLAVAEEGNITRASERLHISQQALSNQIARMEEELGCTLFSRGKTLELTYSGKQFKQSAEKILDINRQTATVLDDINSKHRGELRIGISHTRGQAILPFILPAFSNLHPLVDLHVIEGSTHVLEEDLRKGVIDVLIGFAPFMLDCAEYSELMKEHLFLVVPNSLLVKFFGSEAEDVCRSYAKSSDISLFKDMPFVLLNEGDRIRTIADREFFRCAVRPQIKLETQNIQTAFALASEGMGLTVCPELYLNNPYVAPGTASSYMRQKVRIFRFFNGDVQDTIAIGYNRERYLSRFASDFIRISKDTFRKPSVQSTKEEQEQQGKQDSTK